MPKGKIVYDIRNMTINDKEIIYKFLLKGTIHMYSHYEHSKIFKRWCVALVITVFILGIIAGFVFRIEKEPLSVYGYSSSTVKPSFNWGLAFIIWISEVIPAAILYAVYSHLENQEIQINILNEIRKK